MALIIPICVLTASVLLIGLKAFPSRFVYAATVLIAIFGIFSGVLGMSHREGIHQALIRSRIGSLTSLYLLPFNSRPLVQRETDFVCPPLDHVQTLPSLPIPNDNRRSVLLISVDALRADTVGKVVSNKELTPNLQRAVSEGQYFSNATTNYPATLLAMGSAFTGLSPGEIFLAPDLPMGIFDLARGVVDEQWVILPESSWFKLPVVEELLFPQIKESFAKGDAATTTSAIKRLRRARSENKSVLAWVHYYSPHAPYQQTAAFDSEAERRTLTSAKCLFLILNLEDLCRICVLTVGLMTRWLSFFRSWRSARRTEIFWPSRLPQRLDDRCSARVAAQLAATHTQYDGG